MTMTCWSTTFLWICCLVSQIASVSASKLKERVGKLHYLRVSIVNEAPNPGGICLSPIFVGIHDGSYPFDIYNVSEPASLAVQSLAEKADSSLLLQEFAHPPEGHRVYFCGVARPTSSIVLCPGLRAKMDFLYNAPLDQESFLSYAAMVLPSNDAFVATDHPRRIPLFDRRGSKLLTKEPVVIKGTQVMDAGTEVNDEAPEHTPLLGIRGMPNAGKDEVNGVVHPHAGFLVEGAQGHILTSPQFGQANFAASSNYRVLKLRIRSKKQLAKRKLLLSRRFVVEEEGAGMGGASVTPRRNPAVGRLQLKFLASGEISWVASGGPFDATDFVSCQLRHGNRTENGPLIRELFNYTATPSRRTFHRISGAIHKLDFLGDDPFHSVQLHNSNEALWLRVLTGNVHVLMTTLKHAQFGEVRGNFGEAIRL